MDATNDQPLERADQRGQANREELVERILQANRADGTVEPLPGLSLNRISSPKGPVHGVTKASFCVIAQGSKVVLMGDDSYRYDPFHYLLATIELPSISQILEASTAQPYLSLRLELDPALVGSVMVETDDAAGSGQGNVRSMDVSTLDSNLLDAVVRLVRLVDCPSEARVLRPLIEREIIYRLLIGDQGKRLRHLAVPAGYTSTIARAVEKLRLDFDKPLRVEDIARDMGMSVSSFHHHFKSVTAMSPLQFQKRLRLHEARRLMLNENLDATSAAFRVGYNDASHFNREYRSLFGVPPMRDVQRMRDATLAYPA